MEVYFWLDDNPERETDAKNMADSMGVDITFYNLKKTDLEQYLTNLISTEKKPALVILDQNLENANRGIFIKGSTVAAYIRESWPDCPIVCITGEDVDNLNSQQQGLFDEVFSISRVSDYYDVIQSIAKGFKTVSDNWPETSLNVIELLKSPEIDIGKLAAVLPTKLKESFADKSSIVEVASWIRQTLMSRPGFLYDAKWFSTSIGIKIESLAKVEGLFEDAKYNGVFNITSSPLWWKSAILEILYDNSVIDGLPWEKGRGLYGIVEEDYSKCFVSDEYFPETVAYVDQSTKPDEQPMKLKYTELHPDFEKMLYFEDIRLMKAD